MQKQGSRLFQKTFYRAGAAIVIGYGVTAAQFLDEPIRYDEAHTYV